MMMTPIYKKGGANMNNVMAIINNALDESFLDKLTGHRSLASVPFGARYRLIDFPLSNLVNSGVTNVGLLLQTKYRSLMDHIGFGKAWDLDRKRNGLFILPQPIFIRQIELIRETCRTLPAISIILNAAPRNM